MTNSKASAVRVAVTITMSGPLFSPEKPGYGSTKGGGGDANILARCSTVALGLDLVSLGKNPNRFRAPIYSITQQTHDSAEPLPDRPRSKRYPCGVPVPGFAPRSFLASEGTLLCGEWQNLPAALSGLAVLAAPQQQFPSTSVVSAAD